MLVVLRRGGERRRLNRTEENNSGEQRRERRYCQPEHQFSVSCVRPGYMNRMLTGEPTVASGPTGDSAPVV